MRCVLIRKRRRATLLKRNLAGTSLTKTWVNLSQARTDRHWHLLNVGDNIAPRHSRPHCVPRLPTRQLQTPGPKGHSANASTPPNVNSQKEKRRPGTALDAEARETWRAKATCDPRSDLDLKPKAPFVFLLLWRTLTGQSLKFL